MPRFVSNAIKFTIVGQTKLSATRESDDIVTLSVVDTGIGMRQEDIPFAPMPFKQLDNSLQRQNEGLGPGLPLAKRFVELHGGTFAIASEPGKGSIVTMQLPGEAEENPLG